MRECNYIDCEEPGVITDGNWWLCEAHAEEVYPEGW